MSAQNIETFVYGKGPQCGMSAITPTSGHIVGCSHARPHAWP